jgi:hypothetical protein
MGVVVWLCSRALESALSPEGLVSSALAVIVPVAAGAVAYLGLATLFHVEELGFVRTAITGRLGGRGNGTEI